MTTCKGKQLAYWSEDIWCISVSEEQDIVHQFDELLLDLLSLFY